ncbi:MAG: cytochrome c biogenesis protein [Bacteroidota bacterium]|nr:cytochrome c biogenesis protein [Bacteroidota bacterium]MDX5428424.1 cytochrome c biogenesis protein [Bacteroidota bacterium]MDX5447058.1 cytochrome c biogenesis protein [Bacteroidota bacterium]MDX5506191.1 cytochrome c biogenesis protein [Bacteroidota bacterium]
MKKSWWKILSFVLILYSVIWGFLGDVPRLPILNETIRNLYFHVAMWFAMLGMMTASLVYSIKYLKSSSSAHDLAARIFAETGLVFATLGLLTGMVWANFTWGAPWTNDPKLNGTAITMLVYFAYLILRGSLDDPEKRGRLSGVYNIFAYVLMIVFIGILPRLTDSLHPGNGGNPGFNSYDMDSRLRMVFYPAVLGWILFGFWVTRLRLRLNALRTKPVDELFENLQ